MATQPPNNDDTDDTCIECGKPAEVIDLSAYGPGKPGGYCTTCFISTHAPANPVPTAVFGHSAEVVTIGDEAQCINCDAFIAAPGAITIPWEAELAEYEAEQKKGSDR